MSDTQDTQQENTEVTNDTAGNSAENAEIEALAKESDSLSLTSVFAFKAGMSSYIDEKGDMHAVTLLKMEPTVVSQVKTSEKDGYAALQVAFKPKKAKRTAQSEAAHLKTAGFEAGAKFVRELRHIDMENAAVGKKLSLEAFAAGDKLKVTGTTIGKGFQGSIKRWGSSRGPMTHGSHYHRRPGSAGANTKPGRIMPGKKFPGHMGDRTKTVTSSIIDILKDENMLVVKGAIPGARNQLVKVTKV